MRPVAKVAVIGAGPYGLSIAAHLTAMGVRPLIFGRPMTSWREGMPHGMRLKSEGFASSLSDPEGSFTLAAFCASRGLPYADINLPVPLETFVAYGEAFQKRFVPQLDTRTVSELRKAPHGFTLRLEDGAEIEAEKAIVATGIDAFRYLPEAVRGLPSELASHTCQHADYSGFAGRHVAVIGAGSSATDAAAALLRAGASVTLICRSPSLRFYPGGKPRKWFEPLVAPMTPLGPGWRKLLCAEAPLVFRAMPERFRIAVVKRFLGPAPCWFVREEIEGKVDVVASATIAGARVTPRGVTLDLAVAGKPKTLDADHVMAGTGFRVDILQLAFLDPAIISALARTEGAPKLSANFESSLPGLHFVGTMAAFEFGPLLRFVCGAEFTARRVARHMAKTARRVGGAIEGYRPLEAEPGPRGSIS